MSRPLPLCQIAVSCVDMARTRRWYHLAFGFLTSGEVGPMTAPELSLTQGLPNVSLMVAWMLDQRHMQLELFEFKSPTTRPKPLDWKPSDVGFTMYSMHAADFDGVLARVQPFGGRLLSEPVGAQGQRRVCLEDPDGVIIEILEADLPSSEGAPGVRWPSVPVAIRAVTLSVPDLARARRLWVDIYGCPEVTEFQLHGPEHDRPVGLAGEKRKALLVRAGNVYVELVQFTAPVGRPRPAGWWLADQGISHLAVRPATEQEFDEVYARALAAGFTSNWKPWDLGQAKAVYLNDGHGFTFELLWCDPSQEHRLGLVPDPGAGA